MGFSKNTGVDCHFLLQRIFPNLEIGFLSLVSPTLAERFFNVVTTWEVPCVKFESHSVVSDSLRPHGLYSPWNYPGQNTRVGSLSLPQGIFLTQGSNPGLSHCGRILYWLSHEEYIVVCIHKSDTPNLSFFPVLLPGESYQQRSLVGCSP